MAASIIASTVTGGANSHQTVSEEINNVATDFVTPGVVGSFTSGSPATGAFGVTQNTGSDMAITVLAGRAYVSGTPSGQDAQVLNARMTSNYTGYTINSNSTGSTRYDWIYLKLDAAKAAAPASDASDVINLYTSRSTSNATDNGSPPTYGLVLAVVTVANGATAITNGNITDKRVQSIVTTQSLATTGWQTLSFPLTYGANNGNKEFTVTTPNDLRGVLSPGMKLNITRSVTPPTQCMSFTAASSQYATKASPTGITFTSAFTCEAWVYLTSYQTSAGVISRFDGTSGWIFRIDNGQVGIQAISSTANQYYQTYQSLPLNRWMHIAATLTPGTPTSTIYINGVSVPINHVQNTSTGMAQGTGSLQIGAYNATNFFNGYISEARVWSVAQTQTAIQNNMAINCVGNETNLVALFQGSGNFNDSTSNANNLTATNGAIATQASNPYNATEYFSVIAVSYSNPTTTVTLDGGTMNNLPNQTLNSPQYSTSANPFGLPSNLKKYRREVLLCSTFTTALQVPTQLPGAIIALTIPQNSTVRVTAELPQPQLSAAGNIVASIWDGANGPGGSGSTQITATQATAAGTNYIVSLDLITPSLTPSAGSHTYSIDAHVGSNTGTFPASSGSPNILAVEVDL